MKGKERKRPANGEIKPSFQDTKVWVSYFSLLDELFAKDKLEIIDSAKTTSIAVSCNKLIETYGVSNLLRSFITMSSNPLPQQIIFD